ncbi:MAG TPA: hypothetical protein VNQ80_12420 [Parapedobacter sp.]|uniref:hypothetical protein n=1 Tax=Parapedobacter sp. TaxID=1958893 RepID=UPI002C81821A|nr:hypothetical protein [Parapedobacter sp.]HWK58142.1 hypothetical protein [Parapedobacter sp.]
MFDTHLNTATRTLHIELPNGLRTRTITMPVTSTQQAINLYNTNVAKYIIATLTRWVKHREWTLRYIGQLNATEQYAIDALKEMLADHSESKLHVIILQVSKHDQNIARIAPGEKSRYHRKYLHEVVPIRYWCQQEYAKRYHPDLKNRV